LIALQLRRLGCARHRQPQPALCIGLCKRSHKRPISRHSSPAAGYQSSAVTAGTAAERQLLPSSMNWPSGSLRGTEVVRMVQPRSGNRLLLADSTHSESGRESPVPADDLSLARLGATGSSVSISAGQRVRKLPLRTISRPMSGNRSIADAPGSRRQ
jgi:hypothetical protein